MIAIKNFVPWCCQKKHFQLLATASKSCAYFFNYNLIAEYSIIDEISCSNTP